MSTTHGPVRVFIASSLDGFIAGPDDDLSWLPPGGGEDHGYDEFMAATGAVLMGRTSYDVVVGFDAAWPYGDTPVFVATSRPLDPVVPTVHAVTGDPDRILAAVHERTTGGIYVDGGVLIRQFMEAGLIDELTVTIVPVILGAGTPLFAGLPQRRRLELTRCRSYPSGLVSMTYRPAVTSRSE